MNPYPPTPPPPKMPGSLKAVRVLLIIQLVLSVVIYAFAFFGLAVTDPRALEVVLLLAGVAMAVLEAYVAFTMGRGGPRTQTLLRVVVGLGLAAAVVSILTGGFSAFGSSAFGVAIAVAILALIQSSSAKEWFRATDPNQAQPYQDERPGGPGQGIG